KDLHVSICSNQSIEFRQRPHKGLIQKQVFPHYGFRSKYRLSSRVAHGLLNFRRQMFRPSDYRIKCLTRLGAFIETPCCVTATALTISRVHTDQNDISETEMDPERRSGVADSGPTVGHFSDVAGKQHCARAIGSRK